MSRTFPESDWKILLDFRKTALDRFCRRIVENICLLSTEEENSWHGRYLKICEYIHSQNKELARIFDNPRRSQALLQLCMMCALDLITEEELACFSTETRQAVERITETV